MARSKSTWRISSGPAPLLQHRHRAHGIHSHLTGAGTQPGMPRAEMARITWQTSARTGMRPSPLKLSHSRSALPWGVGTGTNRASSRTILVEP
jgi:hypothetical protein